MKKEGIILFILVITILNLGFSSALLYKGAKGQSCNQVCSSKNLTCVQEDWNDDNCEFCKSFYPNSTCSSLSNDYGPAYNTVYSKCVKRSSTIPQNCSRTAGAYERICLCEGQTTPPIIEPPEEPEETTQSPSCIDSDRPNNLAFYNSDKFTAGNVTASGLVYRDICYSSAQLKESYCLSNKTQAYSPPLLCGSGFSCITSSNGDAYCANTTQTQHEETQQEDTTQQEETTEQKTTTTTQAQLPFCSGLSNTQCLAREDCLLKQTETTTQPSGFFAKLLARLFPNLNQQGYICQDTKCMASWRTSFPDNGPLYLNYKVNNLDRQVTIQYQHNTNGGFEIPGTLIEANMSNGACKYFVIKYQEPAQLSPSAGITGFAGGGGSDGGTDDSSGGEDSIPGGNPGGASGGTSNTKPIYQYGLGYVKDKCGRIILVQENLDYLFSPPRMQPMTSAEITSHAELWKFTCPAYYLTETCENVCGAITPPEPPPAEPEEPCQPDPNTGYVSKQKLGTITASGAVKNRLPWVGGPRGRSWGKLDVDFLRYSKDDTGLEAQFVSKVWIHEDIWGMEDQYSKIVKYDSTLDKFDLSKFFPPKDYGKSFFIILRTTISNGQINLKSEYTSYSNDPVNIQNFVIKTKDGGYEETKPLTREEAIFQIAEKISSKLMAMYITGESGAGGLKAAILPGTGGTWSNGLTSKPTSSQLDNYGPDNLDSTKSENQAFIDEVIKPFRSSVNDKVNQKTEETKCN